MALNYLFHIFSSLSILCGIFVIQSKNPVHSILFLILVFFNATGLLVLLGLDFFALIFLIIYVGAITTLFLFVVMMLNIKIAEISEKRLRYLPIGALLGILFLAEIFYILNNELVSSNLGHQTLPFTLLSTGSGGSAYVYWGTILETLNNIEAVGSLIYTYYFYAFILASLILLIAMIGAVMLTLEKSSFVKRQDIFEQTTREYSKTVVKLA